MLSKFFAGSLAFVMLILASCDRGGSPAGDDAQRRLTEYISTSFSIDDYKDKEDLLKYLTGGAKLRLAAWSEDQFREAFLGSKRKFIKLLIREVKKPTPAETHITYELIYTDEGKGHNAKVTNRKLAQMVLDQNQWFIKEVSNIKELVEYQNEMSLP